MTKDKAMQLALEALVNNRYIIESEINPPEALEEFDVAIAALRQTLEQPEQEPVAQYSDIVSEGGLDPRNTAPPKREWIGLTFEEADRLASKYSSGFRSDHNDALHLVGEVEALLKEKNT